jgi:type IV pilus assembly protein PilM
MIRDILFDYFPLPQFLSLPHYGVHISENSLRYIHLHKKKKTNHKKTIDWGEITISRADAIGDFIYSKEELAAQLKKFRSVTNASYIALSLPAKYIHIFETEIKKTDTEIEIQSLLEFRYKEKINLPFKEVIFDYVVSDSKENGGVDVIVAAYPKEIVDTWCSICKEEGLMPVSFTVDIEAVAKAVVDDHTTENVMVVNIGSSETVVGVVCANILRYSAVVNFGTKLIIPSLKKVNPTFSPEEVVSFKENVGVLPIRKRREESEVLLQIMSLLKDELISQLQRWHSKESNKERRIDKIILCGESVYIAGLVEYLGKEISVPVIRGDVWKHVVVEDTIPPIPQSKSTEFATSIGLALEKKV